MTRESIAPPARGWKTLTFAALTTITVHAYGAVAYRCTITTTYPHSHVVAHVTADGAKQRVDFDNDAGDAIVADVLLSTDGGATYNGLNTRLKTWFGPNAAANYRDHSFLSVDGGDGKSIVSTFKPEGDESEAGYAVHKYAGHLSYQLGGMTTSFTLLVWTTDALPASAALRIKSLSTGIRNVDAEWMPKVAAAKGFPMKMQMAITRHYEGGRPITNLINFDVDDVHSIESPSPATFEVPSTYVKQPPVIGAPGTVKPF